VHPTEVSDSKSQFVQRTSAADRSGWHPMIKL